MPRKIGATNIIDFSNRTEIATSTSVQVRHVADIEGTPQHEFQELLKHQQNFLTWIDQRHERVVELKRVIHDLRGEPHGRAGAKTETFIKYRWYAEQLALLGAINAFETFFKKTFVRLGEAIKDYVEADAFKDMKIDSSLIWGTAGQISASALLFEASLFHDLEAIDLCTFKLVGSRRYNQKSPSAAMRSRVKALRGIFQIRHTMSHNNGLVTEGDAAKFRRFGYTANRDEIIDPSKDSLAKSIFRELNSEASEFTDWLAQATADFLTDRINNSGASVPYAIREDLEDVLGVHPCLTAVAWS